jgi:hypothetical protein
MSSDKISDKISISDNKNSAKSLLNSEGFGISNGVSTILALLAGFYATKTPKFTAMGALLSLLLTDPINDSFSIYVSMKHNNPDIAYNTFIGTFVSQVGIQLLFLIILFYSSNVYNAFIISSVIGMLLLLYDYNKRFKNKKAIMKELSKILTLIFITFVINTLFYKYYHNKL